MSIDTAQDILKNGIKSVQRERNWLLLEGKFIDDLKHAIQRNDSLRAQRFERRAARAERRLYRFEVRIIETITLLKDAFPEWRTPLTQTEQQLKLYEANILKRVSGTEGTIPRLLKRTPIDWHQLHNEADAAYTFGVQQLLLLLEHLEREFYKILATAERKNEPQKITSYEHALNTAPFLVLFHRSNQKDHVNSILAMSHKLPDYYLGRRLEYAFETDFFWIEHGGKLSTFLGHAPHGLIPWKGWMVKRMKEGAGLLLPQWLLSRIGKVRIVVEVKSGWGTDTHALDQLVDLLKKYRLDGFVTFYAFSVWVLQYLKARLPQCFAILICMGGPLPGRILQYPFNRPFTSLKLWGLFPKSDGLSFVDCLAIPAKKSEEKIINQVSTSAEKKKWHFGGMVRTKEQFDALLRHGARGAMLWADPQKIIEWAAVDNIPATDSGNSDLRRSA